MKFVFMLRQEVLVLLTKAKYKATTQPFKLWSHKSLLIKWDKTQSVILQTNTINMNKGSFIFHQGIIHECIIMKTAQSTNFTACVFSKTKRKKRKDWVRCCLYLFIYLIYFCSTIHQLSTALWTSAFVLKCFSKESRILDWTLSW